MLLSACVVPSAPLLLPGLAPDDTEVAALRDQCVQAVRAMLSVRPAHVVVVGGPTARTPVARFGPRSVDDEDVRLGDAVSRWLLDAAGWAGARPRFVDVDTTTRVGPAEHGARTGAVVFADLSAAVADASPRPRNESAVAMSDTLARAVVEADVVALDAIDTDKASSLAIEGGPALRYLAAAAGGTQFEPRPGFRGAPFGVEYVVAAWLPRLGRPDL